MTANTPEAMTERCLELERLLREKDDELSAVRKALRYGADDSLWPPGQSMGDAVENLVNLYDCYVPQNNPAVTLTRG